ncbi:MAG: helix-turn-helix domain-containing protein [Clostridiales bacterium]|nr:helix-turn-helix domain-containing protein [Clostridiales bacterium]
MSRMDYIVNVEGEKVLIETQQNEARKEVIELFKNYRKELGMTQTELGRRIGIPQSNVTRFESGNYNPTLEFLVKTAAAMGKRVKVSLED